MAYYKYAQALSHLDSAEFDMIQVRVLPGPESIGAKDAARRLCPPTSTRFRRKTTINTLLHRDAFDGGSS